MRITVQKGQKKLMLFRDKYRYYEVVGEIRILRQVAESSTRSVKERKPIEEFIKGKWVSIPWESWSNLTLSYLTDQGAKDLMKKCK